MNKIRTSIYLDALDKELLARIRAAYRLDSDAAAVRFAVSRVASEIQPTKADKNDAQKKL